MEIKSNRTFSPHFLNGLKYFHDQAPNRAEGGALIYGGEMAQKVGEFTLIHAENCAELMLEESGA
jgi:hypothetical protein